MSSSAKRLVALKISAACVHLLVLSGPSEAPIILKSVLEATLDQKLDTRFGVWSDVGIAEKLTDT